MQKLMTELEPEQLALHPFSISSPFLLSLLFCSGRDKPRDSQVVRELLLHGATSVVQKLVNGGDFVLVLLFFLRQSLKSSAV